MDNSNVEYQEHNCFYCEAIDECFFKCQTQKELLSHYSRVHRDCKTFKAPCLYSTCHHTSKFKSFSTLYKHLKSKHQDFFLFEEVQTRSNFATTNNVSLSGLPVEPGGTDLNEEALYHDEPPSNPQSPSSADDSIDQHSVDEDSHMLNPGLFVLDLLEARKFNQVDVQHVIKGVNTFINQAISRTLVEVSKHLAEAGCPHNLELLKPSADQDHFSVVRSQYLQRKYFVEELGMVPPYQVDLKSKPNYKNKDHVGRPRRGKAQTAKKHKYVCVSLIRQLVQLLNKPDVHEEVFTRKLPGDGDILTKYEDGTAFKQNKLFIEHPNALQIHLYVDDVQMCNNSGSKVVNNKLTFVYFTIGNLPPKFRTSFKDIHLLAIFRRIHVKQFGLNKLLKPIVRELKKLEKGVSMTLLGKCQKVFGTLTALIADNLGSHEIGRFRIGFSRGFRRCRYCLATEDELYNNFSDREFIPRTKESHAEHLEGLQTDRAAHFAKVYGIDGESILDEMEYFSVIGGLVPDVMHDLLEGIVPLTICEVILKCIGDKYFTLEQLNDAISNFDYSFLEIKDRPSLLEMSHLKKKSLRQSAAQSWQLAVMLPLIIGSSIPDSSEVWHCYQSLLEICRLVFSSTISQLQIALLESLIDEFLSSFKTNFNRKIIPKMHFLVHYPRFIRLIGPLGSFWCMRFEAKHSYFKQLSDAIHNYINLPLTLSWRHQQWQCKNLNQNSNYLIADLATPMSKSNSLFKLEFAAGQVAQFYKCHLSDTIENYKWIKINSSTYSVNKTLILCKTQAKNLNETGLVSFSKICSICQRDGTFIFICQVYRTLKFDSHFQAFIVRPRTDILMLLIPIKKLFSHLTFSLHRPVPHSLNETPFPPSNFLVPTKHEIREVLPYVF